MIKKWIIGAAMVLSFANVGYAQVHVDGYFKKNGTYVEPHYRSAPNSSISDNYSTKGNSNPYTGQMGTVDPFQHSTPRTPQVFETPSPVPSFGNFGDTGRSPQQFNFGSGDSAFGTQRRK